MRRSLTPSAWWVPCACERHDTDHSSHRTWGPFGHFLVNEIKCAPENGCLSWPLATLPINSTHGEALHSPAKWWLSWNVKRNTRYPEKSGVFHWAKDETDAAIAKKRDQLLVFSRLVSSPIPSTCTVSRFFAAFYFTWHLSLFLFHLMLPLPLQLNRSMK